MQGTNHLQKYNLTG